jgi:hypothetical protein
LGFGRACERPVAIEAIAAGRLLWDAVEDGSVDVERKMEKFQFWLQVQVAGPFLVD